ncbi:MAG TPA: type II CAAX endopeptidase family protein [Xanthobacteraceae bacterium]|jgi:membrane protease YdiL (CAAX protease family)
MKAARAFGLLVGQFLVVYLPAFAAVGALRMSIDRAVPTIIAVTTISASIVMLVIARSQEWSFSDFGFRWPAMRYIGHALVLGVPLAIAVAVLLNHFRELGPLAGLHIAPWLALICFGMAAPVQEEVIFRGLLQTHFQANLMTAGLIEARASRVAVIVVALVFAVIHLEVGPMTAIGAVALGLLAGELRRRSASLVPAILCHSLFNIAGLLF